MLRDVRRLLREIFVTVVSFAGLAGVVWWSWSGAGEHAGKMNTRIEWVVEARRTIPRGARIEEDDLLAHAEWQTPPPAPPEAASPPDAEAPPESDAPAAFTPQPEWLVRKTAAVGRYAAKGIPAGARLSHADVSVAPPIEAGETGMIVPVQIETPHAAALVPGMRLVFVGDEKKVLPVKAFPKGEAAGDAFELVAVLGAWKEDAEHTSILVRASRAQSGCVRSLAAGTWRPVVVESPPVLALR